MTLGNSRARTAILGAAVLLTASAGAAVASPGDSVSGASYGAGADASHFTITFKNTGSAPQLYDYVQAPAGMSVTAGGFTSGGAGTFTPGGAGAGTGEWSFSPGLPVNGTFMGTFVTDGQIPCGSPLQLGLNSDGNPANYTLVTLPFGGTCGGGGGGGSFPTLQAALLGAPTGTVIRFDPQTETWTIVESGTLVNPSSSTPTQTTQLQINGTILSLPGVTGPGITPGSGPGIFNVPAIAPGGSIPIVATFSEPTPPRFGDYQEIDDPLLVGDKAFGGKIFWASATGTIAGVGRIPGSVFGSAGPRRAHAAAARPRNGAWGTFKNALPAGASNTLAAGAADPNEVTKVQVAMVLVKGRPKKIVESPKAKATAAQCLDYVGKGRVTRQKVKGGVCTGLVWRNAVIVPHSDAWYYGFDPSHPLPAGTWTAYVRAVTRAGIGDPSIADQYKSSPYRHVFSCRPHKCN